MKFARRNMLKFFWFSALAAFFAPMRSFAKIGEYKTVLRGYVQPFGFTAHTYLLSESPMHCLDCYDGPRDGLILVRSVAPLPKTSGRVVLEGNLVRHNASKTGGISTILERGRLAKNASKMAAL